MTIEERKKQIEEHFKNITIEEFENNLERAGINEIKPSGHEMIVKEK